MSLYDVALTGMRSSVAGFTTAAQNIANVNTPGYRAQRYDSATGTAQTPSRPEAVPEEPTDELPESDVDLAGEIISMKMYELGFRANAATLYVADRVQKNIIDILA